MFVCEVVLMQCPSMGCGLWTVGGEKFMKEWGDMMQKVSQRLNLQKTAHRRSSGRCCSWPLEE